jgi:hypothetical protein
MGIVDRFSKCVFLAITHLFIAQKIAHLFLENVYKFNGLPYSIVTYKDKVFTSLFWKKKNVQTSRGEIVDERILSSLN